MDKSTLEHFVKYQSIYVFLVYLIITWTLIGARLTALELQVAENSLAISTNQTAYIEIQSRLASIETSLEFIKRAVNE